MKNLPQHVYPPQISLRGGYTGWYIHKDAWTVGSETENISTETERFFKKREGFKYKILNRGDQSFYMGAENAKIKSAEKSAETGGHRVNLSFPAIVDFKEELVKMHFAEHHVEFNCRH